MSITATAIRNDRVTLLTVAVILFAGFGALQSLPRAEDPGFTVRTALVQTLLPGASPERMESLITNTIEKTVQEMPELSFVESRTRTGVSMVFVNVKDSIGAEDIDDVWDDLRKKMDAVTGDLPSEAIGPFVDDEFGDVYPVMLTIAADDFSFAELQDIADEVRDTLLRESEVARVDIFGEQDERIFVEYDVARLAEVGLSPSQLGGILRQQNIIVSGGTLTVFGEDIALEPSGNYEVLEDIGRTIVPLPNGRVVYLGDLVDIRLGYVDPATSWMHTTGRRCLGLSISAPKGTGNVSVLGAQVKSVVARIERDYPVGVDFDLVLFQPDFIDDQVNDFIENLAQAIAIVLLVMLISLGLRTGVVVSSLIPTAMLATLMLMQFFSIGLDQISIAALIIALGMLVDNAIVMSESIMVQMQEGKSSFQAAVDSASELRVPLLTSSLTTSAAFLPIFLAESAMGEYTGALFVVVTITLLCSWALSLTLMPLLCKLFLRVTPATEGDRFDTPFYRAYRGILTGAVKHPLVSVALTVALFVGAIQGLGLVPNEFMPKSDSSRLIANLALPVGTSIETTEAMVQDVEDYILAHHMAGDDGEGFINWSTYIGDRGGPNYRLAFVTARAGSENAQLVFTATSRAFLDSTITKLRDYVDRWHPEVRQTWNAESLGPAAEFPVSVRVSGPEIEPLFRLVEDVKTQLRATPGAMNIQDDWGVRTKKLRVVIDQARARRAGASSEDVATSLNAGLTGIEVSEFRAFDEIVPIVLRSRATHREDLRRIENMDVFVQSTGASIPLSQIARLEVDWQPSKILRRDRDKTVTINADLEAGYGAIQVGAALNAWLEEASASWPRGYGFELGGDQEESAEANASIVAKLPIAGFLILLLLMTQFNSFRRTAIVLLTIPLGLIGVTIGLLVTGEPFSFFALLGVISLAGIIINNAIVLLDRIKLEMETNGLSADQAVIESAQRRLRPILVTTATTCGGLLPLWVFGGPMWAPMAVAILFGLLFATLLTLGVVPVLYSLFFRVRYA